MSLTSAKLKAEIRQQGLASASRCRGLNKLPRLFAAAFLKLGQPTKSLQAVSESKHCAYLSLVGVG